MKSHAALMHGSKKSVFKLFGCAKRHDRGSPFFKKGKSFAFSLIKQGVKEIKLCTKSPNITSHSRDAAYHINQYVAKIHCNTREKLLERITLVALESSVLGACRL